MSCAEHCDLRFRSQVSGVLGIVACGVVLSYYGKPRVSSPVLPSLMDFWKTLQFFADTVIFFLSGEVYRYAHFTFALVNMSDICRNCSLRLGFCISCCCFVMLKAADVTTSAWDVSPQLVPATNNPLVEGRQSVRKRFYVRCQARFRFLRCWRIYFTPGLSRA